MKNKKSMLFVTSIVTLTMAVSSLATFAADTNPKKDNIGPKGQFRHEFAKKMDLETLKAKLAEKVAAGAMTQEQADKIIAQFQEMEAKKTEMKAKFDAMTPEQKAQYKADMKAKMETRHGKRGAKATKTPSPEAATN